MHNILTMVKYTKIKRIDIKTKGEANYIAIASLQFPLHATSVDFYYKLVDTIDLESVNVEENIVSDGYLKMESTDLKNWGADDDYVIDWVLSKLGLEKLTT